MDCFFAETGIDKELNFNQEDEEEKQYFSWAKDVKTFIYKTNLYERLKSLVNIKISYSTGKVNISIEYFNN